MGSSELRNPMTFSRIALLPLFLISFAASAAPSARNVFIITIDGLRWQEVFTGADVALMNRDDGGVNDNVVAGLREEFGGETEAVRRQKLMPFFWTTVAGRGQVLGNRAMKSTVQVSNAEKISYPGYSELLTGRVNPLITSNAPIPNSLVTVLEWIHERPGFAGRVGAFAEWRVFNAIINVGRSRLPVWTSGQPVPASLATPRLREIERWMEDITPLAPDEHFDAFVYHAAMDFITQRKPRVFLLGFGEPDTWAHNRRYDRYLHSIRRCDRFIRQLWEQLQSMDDYRDNTVFILTPDHGRGVTPRDWTSHGKKVERAEETWLAAFGPGIVAGGERRETAPVYQAQIAATAAAMVGEDFRSAFPDAAAPIGILIETNPGR